MRRLLMLILVAVTLVAFAAPVSASPEPCIIGCIESVSTDTK
ncbi:MAG: hypothetical protein ACOY94_09115 [Bacillota bacterium]